MGQDHGPIPQSQCRPASAGDFVFTMRGSLGLSPRADAWGVACRARLGLEPYFIEIVSDYIGVDGILTTRDATNPTSARSARDCTTVPIRREASTVSEGVCTRGGLQLVSGAVRIELGHPLGDRVRVGAEAFSFTRPSWFTMKVVGPVDSYRA